EPAKKQAQEEEEPEPPRNFTFEQLKKYDGSEEDEPIYVALRGVVFDVSSAPTHYGKDGAYNLFAGHDATRNLAKMSFEEDDLNKPSTEGFSVSEIDSLDGWYTTFKEYKQYPIVGRVVEPPKPRKISKEELQEMRGKQTCPEGYATAPICISVKGNVYDVSFGGVTFYMEGAAYHLFAGKDASRALAKMSFKDEDVNSTELKDLSEKELKVLDDWENTFKNRKKYPIIGFHDGRK
ncbi:unnamed protein product, partial [Heterosigma akashiwo]